MESGIPVTIVIQNPSYTDKELNTVPGNRNPRSGIQNPSLSRISLHWGELQLKKQNCILYFLESYMRPSVNLQANKHPYPLPHLLKWQRSISKGKLQFFLISFSTQFWHHLYQFWKAFFLYHSSLCTDAPLPSEKKWGERLSARFFRRGWGRLYTGYINPIPLLSVSQRVLLWR